MTNVIVRPKVYEKYRSVLRGSRLLIAEGEVQSKGNVINLLLTRAGAMPYALTEAAAG